MQLKDVAKTLFEKIQGLESSHEASLQTIMVQGDALIDSLYVCVQENSPALNALLEPVIDELFIDLHVGLLIAMGGQFKASLLLLRTVLESSIYIVYFVDHPVEARLWADFGQDMSFTDTLASICTAKYIQASSGTLVSEDELRNIFKCLSSAYRELSERVHGKYRFLQIHENDETASLANFVTLLEGMFKCLEKLLTLRRNSACKTTPTSYKQESN